MLRRLAVNDVASGKPIETSLGMYGMMSHQPGTLTGFCDTTA